MDFDSIYQSYFKDVYLYLRSLAADADTAEEIAQATFEKALRAIDTFDGAKDIRAWLFTIARNAYYNECKKKRRITGPESLTQIADPQPTVVERVMDGESADLIHRFLHDMKEPYKEVFTLRVFGELPFEKIARLFGKSPGWARVVFYRAKTQIQDYMEELNDE